MDTTVNLKGLWHLNKGSGLVVYDESGYGNDGALEGTTPAWVDGISGKAVNLPGVNEYINCGNNAPLDNIGNGSFWISFWMKSKDTIPLTWCVLCAKFFNSADHTIHLSSYGTGNVLRFASYIDGIGVAENFNAAPFDTNWNHIVIIVNRTTDKVLCYMNNVKDVVEIDISLASADLSCAGNLSWGAKLVSSNPYEGILDELRVYDGLPADGIIEFLYNNPSGGINYIRTISDGVGISDSLSRSQGFIRTITDTLGITDRLARAGAFFRSIADAIGITDSISTEVIPSVITERSELDCEMTKNITLDCEMVKQITLDCKMTKRIELDLYMVS